MEEKKKISFFKRILYSIKDFEKYQIFAFEKVRSAIKYFVTFILIYTILVTICMAPTTIKNINSGIEYFKTEIPDFEYKDNKLAMKSAEPKIIQNDEESIILIIDSNTNEQTKIDEYTKKISGFANGILLLNDRIIYKNGQSINTNIIPYEQLATKIELSNFTKQDVINKIEEYGMVKINVNICIIILLQIYITYLVQALIIAVEVGLFGFIISRISGLRLKYSNCFNIAIYSLTLSTLLSVIAIALKTFLNFEIKYVDIMYMLISYIYVITAILMIKSDLIKKHIELMAIQAKIQKELEEKAREEQEDKKEEKEGTEDKKEKKENKEEDENIGKEAKGET